MNSLQEYYEANYSEWLVFLLENYERKIEKHLGGQIYQINSNTCDCWLFSYHCQAYKFKYDIIEFGSVNHSNICASVLKPIIEKAISGTISCFIKN